MKAAELDRRRLVQLLLALGISATAPRATAAAKCTRGILEGIDAQFIAELAREYLASGPDEADLRRVTRLLTRGQDERRVIDELNRMIQADYKANRIVNLSGWFVSQTEGAVFTALDRCAI